MIQVAFELNVEEPDLRLLAEIPFTCRIDDCRLRNNYNDVSLDAKFVVKNNARRDSVG